MEDNGDEIPGLLAAAVRGALKGWGVALLLTALVWGALAGLVILLALLTLLF